MTKRENFIKEFQDLLKKYDAEINIEDISNSSWYPDEIMVVMFNYDSVEEAADNVNIGRWVDANKEIK